MKTMQAKLFILVGAILIGVCLASKGQTSGRRTQSSGESNPKSPCGTNDKIARKGGECIDPIFELIAGRRPIPKSDVDVIATCNLFNNASRCIRLVAKDCLTGLHKASVSSVATATRRFYSSECKSKETRAPYLEPLKCSIRNGAEMDNLYKVQTGIMQGIRDLPITPEEKLVKMCCVLIDIDVETSKIFDKTCPESTPTVLKLIHAIADDARSTLCRNPKCKGVLDVVKNNKYTPPQNFIEPVLQILLQMNV